jgi:hypothetical protein
MSDNSRVPKEIIDAIVDFMFYGIVKKCHIDGLREILETHYVVSDAAKEALKWIKKELSA